MTLALTMFADVWGVTLSANMLQAIRFSDWSPWGWSKGLASTSGGWSWTRELWLHEWDAVQEWDVEKKVTHPWHWCGSILWLDALSCTRHTGFMIFMWFHVSSNNSLLYVRANKLDAPAKKCHNFSLAEDRKIVKNISSMGLDRVTALTAWVSSACLWHGACWQPRRPRSQPGMFLKDHRISQVIHIYIYNNYNIL